MNKLIRRYQRLLAAEETLDSVDEALSLVEDGLGARVVVGETERELEMLDKEQREHEAVWSRLDEAIKEFDAAEFRQAMARRLKRKDRILRRARAFRVAAALATFPEHLERLGERVPGAQYSFVMDALLLLFHHAYFALLPSLELTEWLTERGTLLHAVRQLADHVPREADRCRILALYFDAMKQPQRAAQHYAGLVNATRSDDHEFMTVLQSCWTHLLEHEQVEGALKMLLDAYPRVPRVHLEEASRLILQTFVHQRNALTHARA